MGPTVGFALCGSFCTFRKAIDALRALTAQYAVVPFFRTPRGRRTPASAHRRISGRRSRRCAARPLHTAGAGRAARPKHLLDLLIVAPLHGQHARQACKRHRRLARQLCLQGAPAQRPPRAAGRFHERRAVRQRRESGCAAGPPSFYFVPFGQDSPTGKPASLVAHFFPAAGGGRGRAAG